MDQTWQPYNMETYAGGVSSAVSPDLLPANQTAWGLNVSFRGTKIHTRPNIHQRMYLPSGLVQGVGYFNIQGGILVVMIAGVPYRLRIGIRNGDFSYEPIVLPFYNSPIIKQVWMCQTVESFLIQDGQSDAIIYDGSTARRADRLKTEVPIGLQMAYGNGRLWVAIQGNQLVAGDIRTADAGTELLFTENQYLSGGGALIFNDAITGLSFIPVTGTSDYGALVALGRNYVDTIRADITQRDSWASYPGFVTNAMRNVGTPSGRTIVQVNQDLMFRDALGGIRSLNTSLSNAYYAQYRGAQSDANVPISREVSRLVEFDSQQLLGFSSGVYFDNRLLMTSSPFLNTQGGVSHRDLVSLDFAPVSTMQGQSPPAYNGTWQGVDWTQLVKGEFNGQSRAFGISSDQDGFNRLWEFDTDQVDDVYISDGTSMTDGTALPVALSPIECFVEYPRIDFGDPKRRKRLTRCDVWMSNLTGQVDLTVYWRPDNNQKWTLWDETSHCAIMQDTATATPHVWKNLLPEQRPLIKSFSIPDTFDGVTTYALATGFGFQIRLAWTGSVRIERVVMWAQAVDDTDYVEREGQEPTCITNDVTGNELRYEIPIAKSATIGGIEYSFTDGTAVLVGHDEFVPSSPPRKYTTRQFSGQIDIISTNGSYPGATLATVSGECNIYDTGSTVNIRATTPFYTYPWPPVQSGPDGVPISVPCDGSLDGVYEVIWGIPAIHAPTISTAIEQSKTGDEVPYLGRKVVGTATDTLLNEYTDAMAVNKAVESLPWSAFGPAVKVSSMPLRTTGFSSTFSESKFRATSFGLEPNAPYFLKLGLYMAIYGSGIYTRQDLILRGNSNSQGELIFEQELPPISGFDRYVAL
jgi:hypothetical protein